MNDSFLLRGSVGKCQGQGDRKGIVVKVVQGSIGAHHANAYFLDLSTRVWKGDRVHAVKPIIGQVRSLVANQKTSNRTYKGESSWIGCFKGLAHHITYIVSMFNSIQNNLQVDVLNWIRVDTLGRHQGSKGRACLGVIHWLATYGRWLNCLRDLCQEINTPRSWRIEGNVDCVTRDNIGRDVKITSIAHSHSPRLARSVESSRPREQSISANVSYKRSLLGLVERRGCQDKSYKSILDHCTCFADDDDHTSGSTMGNVKLYIHLLQNIVDRQDRHFSSGKRDWCNAHVVGHIVQDALVVLLDRSPEQASSILQVGIIRRGVDGWLKDRLATILESIIAKASRVDGGRVHLDGKNTARDSVFETNALIDKILRVHDCCRNKRQLTRKGLC